MGGGSPRDLAVVTGPGPWYCLGEALVEVRWGDVHDGTGTPQDAYVWTTAVTMRPQPIVAGYPQRGSMETTVQECRESVPLESTKGASPHTG
jgi:hypothetical protein